MRNTIHYISIFLAAQHRIESVCIRSSTGLIVWLCAKCTVCTAHSVRICVPAVFSATKVKVSIHYIYSICARNTQKVQIYSPPTPSSHFGFMVFHSIYIYKYYTYSRHYMFLGTVPAIPTVNVCYIFCPFGSIHTKQLAAGAQENACETSGPQQQQSAAINRAHPGIIVSLLTATASVAHILSPTSYKWWATTTGNCLFPAPFFLHHKLGKAETHFPDVHIHTHSHACSSRRPSAIKTGHQRLIQPSRIYISSFVVLVHVLCWGWRLELKMTSPGASSNEPVKQLYLRGKNYDS